MLDKFQRIRTRRMLDETMHERLDLLSIRLIHVRISYLNRELRLPDKTRLLPNQTDNQESLILLKSNKLPFLCEATTQSCRVTYFVASVFVIPERCNHLVYTIIFSRKNTLIICRFQRSKMDCFSVIFLSFSFIISKDGLEKSYVPMQKRGYHRKVYFHK